MEGRAGGEGPALGGEVGGEGARAPRMGPAEAGAGAGAGAGGGRGGELVGELTSDLEGGCAHHEVLLRARAALGGPAAGADALRALAEAPPCDPARRREVQLTALILGALEAEYGREPGPERPAEGVFRAGRAPPQLPLLQTPEGAEARFGMAALVDACLQGKGGRGSGGGGWTAPPSSPALSTRSLLKVAQAFGLGREDLSSAGLEGLLHQARGLLAEGPASLVGGLVTQFRMGELVDSGRLLEFLAEEGRDEQSAGALASYLVEDVQARYIERLLELGRFKAAHKCTHELHLEARFPRVERQYWDSTLRKLARKGLWDVACSFAERKAPDSLAPYLFDLVLRSGDMAAAVKVKDRFPGPLGGADLSSRLEELGFDEVSVREQYLRLPSEVGLEFVDSWAGLLEAVETLERSDTIGIDCEWKPKFGKGEPSSEVALCQLATADRVFLLDMTVLEGKGDGSLNDALGRVIGSKFTREGPRLLLGYAVHEDLRRMARRLHCFRHVPNVVDLAQMWEAHTRGERPTPKGGLAGLAEECLGKPLNKAMQMSNWEARPLTADQQHYAGLDAFVLLSIRDALLAREAMALRPKDLDACCSFTYHAGEKRGRSDTPRAVSPGQLPKRAAPAPQSVAPRSHRDVQDSISIGSIPGVSERREPPRVFQTGAGASATSAEAAEALGVEPDRILKSLCAVGRTGRGEGEYGDDIAVLLVLQGDKVASLRRVETRLGLEPGTLRMASPTECVTRFGYEPGAVPPFGHRDGVVTLVDSGVVESAGDFYAGGGSLGHSVGPLSGGQIFRLSGGEVAKVSTNGPPTRSETIPRSPAPPPPSAGTPLPGPRLDAGGSVGRWGRLQGWLAGIARPVRALWGAAPPRGARGRRGGPLRRGRAP